jgi:multidrug resistance efflux pump
MTNRWIAAGVGLLVLVVVATGAATVARQSPTPSPGGAEPPAETPVVTQSAELVDSFLRERIYTGTLIAERRSTLSFERSGKVIELIVDEGDAVTKGQVVACLDTRRLDARRAKAQADLAQATALLSELKAGPRPQTIAAARAEVENLAAQRDLAEKTMKRRDKLVATSAVSREEYELAMYDYRAAAARTEVAQKNLEELEAGERQERIDAQVAQVAALEATLADILHELDDSVLHAPYDGCIARRRIDEGTVVVAGAPVLELIETGAIEAWVGVPPASARSFAAGDKTTLRIDGREFAATVRSVRPELDAETRTQNVVLRIENPADLVAGEVVRLGVAEPVTMSGFWIPTQALSPDRRGLWSVLVIEGGKAAQRAVEVIENAGDRSFVRGSLQPGEAVIVAGAHRVVAGQRVEADPSGVKSAKPTASLSKL